MTPQELKSWKDWLRFDDVTAKACPHGNMPELVTIRVGRGLVKYYLESRKWFGLRQCCVGPAVLDEEHTYGRRGASRAWNDHLARTS